jgi:hypothetical protein
MQQRYRKRRRHAVVWAVSIVLSVASLTAFQFGRFLVANGPDISESTRLLGASNQSTAETNADVNDSSPVDSDQIDEFGTNESSQPLVGTTASSSTLQLSNDSYASPPLHASWTLGDFIPLEPIAPSDLAKQIRQEEDRGANSTEWNKEEGAVKADSVQLKTKDKVQTKTPQQVLWDAAAAKGLKGTKSRTSATMDTQKKSAKLVLQTKPKSVDTNREQKEQQERYSRKAYIDVISIGTLTKPQLQNAQQRTFGSHPAVRNFFRINEHNDTDATCHTNLTLEQFELAADFCSELEGQSYEAALMRRRLKPFQEYQASTGWMCAQKRPIDGLWRVLQRYKAEGVLPSYLIVVDDDTYLNMNPLVGTLHNAHAPHELFALGGCIFTLPKELRFNFPYGGFGSVFTRKLLENLMRPIYCQAPKLDGFTRFACWRLKQNLIGERQFFKEGMSVAELMYSYSTGLKFTEVDTWTNGIGFCFHSDQAIGYFIGYYHVGIPDHRLAKAELSDKLRKHNFYSYVTIGYGDQCENERNECDSESMICHYIRPGQMDKLYAGE